MIKIKYNPEADTRTMKELPSKEALKSASLSHIGDVSACIQFIINNLVKAINNHDRDKIEDIDGFYRDVKETLINHKDFTELPWYKNHKKENHHRIDSDVLWVRMTIEDVIENLIDKMTATAARRGHLTDKEIISIIDGVNPNIFKLALYNTLTNLKGEIEIEY